MVGMLCAGRVGELRDWEMELKAQIAAIKEKGKEKSKSKSNARDEGPTVIEENIEEIVSTWTRIHVEKVSTYDSDIILKMDETLHHHIIGKDESIIAISRAIRRERVGLKNPNRPIASFIF